LAVNEIELLLLLGISIVDLTFRPQAIASASRLRQSSPTSATGVFVRPSKKPTVDELKDLAVHFTFPLAFVDSATFAFPFGRPLPLLVDSCIPVCIGKSSSLRDSFAIVFCVQVLDFNFVGAIHGSGKSRVFKPLTIFPTIHCQTTAKTKIVNKNIEIF